MTDFKVGDKVIIKKANIVDQHYKYGTIVKLEYDPNYNGVYFYRISGYTKVHHEENPRGYVTWSCNIFTHLKDEMELDIVAIRQDKLDQLV